jgi:tellurite methyltransferase
MTGGYDEGYKACSCFWGIEPGSFVKRLSNLLHEFEGIRVLDAGCGEGKNAAFLSAKGAHVVALDISAAAFKNGRAAWPLESIQWIKSDIRRHYFAPASFDVVLAYGLYHCLASNLEIEQVHAKLSRITTSGGYHVVCTFNDRSQDLAAHPGFKPCLLSHRFYLDLYRSWELICELDEDLYEVHPHNQILHHHSITRLIVRRPP